MARRRLSRVSNSQDDLTKPLTEYTISILKTNPSDRSDATLKRLKQITYEIEFFKRLSDEYSEKTHLDCCKQMQYELVPCGCYVFMYGDVGDKFYIIVEGTADVLVPDAKDRPKKIGQLKAGNAFGELALIRNKPRMASVLCTSDCHLATLNKKDYDAILKSASKEQLESKVNFLASLHVFENWKRAALINLSYFFIEHSIKPKTLLYKEGSVVSKVFLVKKGEFKIYKTIFDPSDDSVLTCRLASKPKRLYLANVSVGEFLGVEDLMSGLKHSSSCESQARVNEYYEIWQNVT